MISVVNMCPISVQVRAVSPGRVGVGVPSGSSSVAVGMYVDHRVRRADPREHGRQAKRQRWKAEYTAAQLAASGPPPGDRSTTVDQAA